MLDFLTSLDAEPVTTQVLFWCLVAILWCVPIIGLKAEVAHLQREIAKLRAKLEGRRTRIPLKPSRCRWCSRHASRNGIYCGMRTRRRMRIATLRRGVTVSVGNV